MPTMRFALISLLCVAALTTAGCGAVGHLTATSGDPVSGKQLFLHGAKVGGVAKAACASCHSLADAGTTANIGPDLDAAFGPDRCQGFDESSIRDVIRGQIAYADANTGTGAVGMPPNLATGQDAKDISVYVASVAGVNGTTGSKKPYWSCSTGDEVSG